MGLNMDYALVNQENNTVENIIVLKEGANWTPPDGFICTPLQVSFGIGDTWDGANFVRAPEPPQPPEPEVGEQPVSEGTQSV